MKNLFISILLCSAELVAKAQLPPKTDGTQYNVRDLDGINGSAFLFDDWQKGEVILQDGTSFKDLDLKYDDYKDKVYYKDDNGETMILTVPVKSFAISTPDGGSPLHFENGFSGVPGSTITSFFIVLGKGKTHVLKRMNKSVEERLEFPVTTPIKHFESSTQYFLWSAGKATQVKQDKKSILAALGSKQSDLDAYIKQNKLNTKDDADLAKLITYYNTLN